MPLNSNSDVDGLLYIISTANLIVLLDTKGFNHKIEENNQEKRAILYQIAMKINPDKKSEVNTIISSILNPTSISTLNSNIAQFNLNKLNDFSMLLDEKEYVDSLRDMIKSIEVEPTINDKLERFTIPFSTGITAASNVLNNINTGNFTELVRPTNILKYFDDLNKWTNTTIDNWIKSLPSKEIDKIINDIPILSTVMPNFSSFTSTLNTTNLTSLLTPSNTYCNPCLVQFLNATSLKSDIMTFLNNSIDISNAWLNGHFEDLSKGIEQFQTISTQKKEELDKFLNLKQNSETLMNLLISNLPVTNADKCMPVMFLITSLQSFITGLTQVFINPLISTINSYAQLIKQGEEFLNSMQSLRDLIPKVDC